jgi:hypothetical protein
MITARILNVDPQMPPGRLSRPCATEFDEELSLPLGTESEGAKIKREFPRNSIVSRKAIKPFYNNWLVWLCWETRANLSPGSQFP